MCILKMGLSHLVFLLITISWLTYGEKQDFNCEAEIKKLTNVIQEMNDTLYKIGIMKSPYPVSTPEKRGTPEGVVAFHAYATHSRILGDQQTIIFDHVVTNLASGYDEQDGQFTAPVAGLYSFSTSLMADKGHYVHAQMVHNGGTVSYVFAAKSAYDYEDDTGTAVANVVLQKGDKVWVRHENDPTGVASLERSYSAFSGFLIQSFL